MVVTSRLKFNSLNIGSKDFVSVIIYKQLSIGNNTLTIGSARDLFFNQLKTNSL